ncbi:MAG: glycosyltransferase [Methylacidiphilales bacterium]|nr:glycosyltransferase [Candidatus Methylacidiphilales bacterium]
MNEDARPPDFFLVIPSYNESGRLPAYLSSLLENLSALPFSTVVRVVDDGSDTGDLESLKKMQRFPQTTGNCKCPAILELPKNLGKGNAILEGWQSSGGAAWVAFVDADGSIPPEEVCRLFQLARQNPGFSLFASRVKMLGRKVERKFSRHLLGRFFAAMVGCSICPDIYDSQCGFKIIPREHYNRISTLLTERKFAFDLDLLMALLSNQLPVIEVPIDWLERKGSKVKVLRDSLALAASVLRLKRKYQPWT